MRQIFLFFWFYSCSFQRISRQTAFLLALRVSLLLGQRDKMLLMIVGGAESGDLGHTNPKSSSKDVLHI